MNSVILMVLTLMSVNTFAATPEVVCGNGGETTVKLFLISRDVYLATVKTESTGGSYPTFKFEDVRQLPNPSHLKGAPITYESKDFRLIVQIDALNHPARVSVPSLGINEEELACN